MQRRQVISGLFAALVLFDCCIGLGVEETYSVSVLGDMHYDAFPEERFHSKAIALWAEKGWGHSMRLLEFKRNAKMWQDIGMRTLEASSKSARPDAAYVLQLGDLVQGDCEDNELHIQMLSEAMALLTNAFPKIPVVTVSGNHDIRQGHDGRGASKPYAEYMTKFESEQLKPLIPDGVKTTTFGFRRGRDLWIFLDFNNGARDVKVVKELLAANEDARYTFICSHGPILPMNVWRCRWFYLGEAKDDALRREMRALFAKRNAFVLAGHVHTLEKTVWEEDGGRITEMVLNTCALNSRSETYPAVPNVLRDRVEQYGEFADNAGGKAERKLLGALYDEYRDGIKEFYNARATGHYILRVGDASVELDYYGHDAVVPTKTFVLR